VVQPPQAFFVTPLSGVPSQSLSIPSQTSFDGEGGGALQTVVSPVQA
jgi:hypothetical protein